MAMNEDNPQQAEVESQGPVIPPLSLVCSNLDSISDLTLSPTNPQVELSHVEEEGVVPWRC